MSEYSESIEQNYRRGDLLERLLGALAASGRDPEALGPDDLAGADEFHIRGREATDELAALADFEPGSHILDMGCGIGGPSRHLAAVHALEVTGLDLTAEYCEVAEELARRVGLADRVRYHHGNALEMPFPDASFDGVWSQHVNMNIPDKPGMFAEMRRVLRPGGRVALYEILAADDTPLHLPVPWARDQAQSFLVEEDGLRRAAESAGFAVRHWEDFSEPAADWFEALLDRVESQGPAPIGLHLILGPETPTLAGNVLRNLREDRIRVVQVLLDG